MFAFIKSEHCAIYSQPGSVEHETKMTFGFVGRPVRTCVTFRVDLLLLLPLLLAAIVLMVRAESTEANCRLMSGPGRADDV